MQVDNLPLFSWPMMGAPLITSGMLIMTLVAARIFLIRAVRNKSEILSHDQRRWISRIKNSILFLLVAGLVLIWAPQLQTLALSLAAVAVALVIATKEMILCLSGAFMRVSTRPFLVGDWISIDGIAGEVIDVNAFSFKLQKVDLAGKSYEMAASTIEIPNSRLLTSPVENLTAYKGWTYHDARIVIPAAESRPRDYMPVLQTLVTEHYAALQDAAEAQHLRLKRKSGVDLPAVVPGCGLTTTDLGHHIYTAHMFLPTKDAARIAGAINLDFLSRIQTMKEEALKESSQPAKEE